MKNFLLILFISILSITNNNAQQDLWTDISESEIALASTRDIAPDLYRTVKLNLDFLCVRRGEEWFVPRGQSVLLAGDRVIFMGRSDAIHQLSGFFAAHREEETRYVVIIGGGTVGLPLARSLEANPRARLKLIERSAERCAEAAQALSRALVLHGDGCDLDLLEDEGVRHAGTLVAVTDSDEKNLLASLLGRQLGVPRIITRVSSAANRRLFERVGIDVPLSARAEANEAERSLLYRGQMRFVMRRP